MSNDTLYPGHDGHDPLPDCDCHPCAIHARNTLRERLAEAEREADQYRRTLRTMDDTGAPRGWSDIVAAAQDRAVKAEQRAERAEAMAEQNAKDAERYRWLREPQDHVCVEVENKNEDGYTNVFYAEVREELDAAIDAERKP